MESDDKIEKILITGGSGMVGKNFIYHEAVKNYTILHPNRKEMDLLNFKQVSQYLFKHKPDLIIHAAGKVGGILANINDPILFLTENVDMGKNLILAARKQNISKLINLSSSCVYPKNIETALEEEFIMTGSLEPTNEAYAIGKIYTQRLCEYINQENNRYLYKTLIPCNLFGRYDNFNINTGHLLPNIINKIHSAKITNKKKVLIWGDGSVRRELMYTNDLVDCLFFSIKNFSRMPNVMNVGIGKDHTVLDYYKAVAKAFKWEGSFDFDLTKPVGQKQKLVSIKKLSKFGWKSNTSLKKAIKETIKFYVEGYKNVL